jgi:hypothetical protein
MFRKFLSLFVMTLTVSLVQAKTPIEIILPFNPGGNATVMAEIIKVHFEKTDNYAVDIKFASNCVNAKRMINQQKTSNVMTIWLATWNKIGDHCEYPVTSSEFSSVLFSGPHYICGREKSIRDYNRQVLRVGTTVDGFQLTQQLLKELGSALGMNFSAVSYDNNAGTEQGFVSKEVDMVFSTGGLTIEKNFGGTCYFTTATVPVSNAVPFTSIAALSANPAPQHTRAQVMYVSTLVSDQQLKKQLDVLLQSLTNSQEFIAVIRQRDFVPIIGTQSEKYQFLTKIINNLNQ